MGFSNGWEPSDVREKDGDRGKKNLVAQRASHGWMSTLFLLKSCSAFSISSNFASSSAFAFLRLIVSTRSGKQEMS